MSKRVEVEEKEEEDKKERETKEREREGLARDTTARRISREMKERTVLTPLSRLLSFLSFFLFGRLRQTL